MTLHLQENDGFGKSEGFDPVFISNIKKKKTDKNCFGQEETVNNLTDIIADDETLKKKLFLTSFNKC